MRWTVSPHLNCDLRNGQEHLRRCGGRKKEDVDDGGEAREYPSQPQNRKSAKAEEF